jgi:23S rRNA pseudouridine1911/1915/1917 synthase
MKRNRLTILHEDDDIIVVDKPAGLLTIPSDPARAGFEDTLMRRVREYVTRPRAPRAYVGVLHRLDRDTSGAVALALRRAAHAAGRELFGQHRFERHYLALVHGVPEPQAGTIRVPLTSRYIEGRRALARDAADARHAVTHYTVLEAMGRASLVALELETGRQHQIRAHLEHLGHPIIGEKVYRQGAASRLSAPRPMLHAWKLAFDHPTRSVHISVEADPPRDFLELVARLQK